MPECSVTMNGFELLVPKSGTRLPHRKASITRRSKHNAGLNLAASGRHVPVHCGWYRAKPTNERSSLS